MAELNLGHVVGPGVPTGGTSGQVLKKNSSTNFDTSWTNNDATTIPMSSSDATSINEAIANLNVATGISDFNSAITTGLYKAPSGTTNQPANDYNVLYVFAYNTVGNDIAQLCVGVNNRRMFFRTRKDGTTWMSWEELALNNQIAKTNTTINVNSYSGSVGANVNRIAKANGIVYLSVAAYVTSTIKFPTQTTLFTIPEGYRPSSNINIPAMIKVSDAWHSDFVTINTSGQITQNFSANATNISIDTTYIM